MHLEVDLTILGDTAKHLREAVDVARDFADNKSSLKDLVSDAGSDTLRRATEDFIDEWDYGMGLIVDDAEKLAEMLEAGEAAYREQEEAISKAFR